MLNKVRVEGNLFGRLGAATEPTHRADNEVNMLRIETLMTHPMTTSRCPWTLPLWQSQIDVGCATHSGGRRLSFYQNKERFPNCSLVTC